jgi:hypothetical protein
MQIEMSNAAAKKKLLLSINLQTVPTTTTKTEKGLEWELQKER